MQEFRRIRSITELVEDIDALNARCTRLRDRFASLAIVFSSGAGLVLVLGLWTRSPLYAVSSAFALAAAFAFAAAAHAMTETGRAAPRVARALAPIRIETRPDRWAA